MVVRLGARHQHADHIALKGYNPPFCARSDESSDADGRITGVLYLCSQRADRRRNMRRLIREPQNPDMYSTRLSNFSRLLLAVLVATPAAASAQAGAYPSFQPPTIAVREFNFALADARNNDGATFLFQWREEAGTRSQFSADVGLATAERRGSDVQLLVAGQYAYMLQRETPDVPLDFLLTVGAGLSFGNYSVLRLPVGLSTGHRFELEGNVAITPYVHPRLSLDFCDCGNGRSALGLSFDLGADFEVSKVISIRAAALFGGGDLFGSDGLGVSLAWRPPGLR